MTSHLLISLALRSAAVGYVLLLIFLPLAALAQQSVAAGWDRFGVLQGPEDNWAICEQITAIEMEMSFLDILPKDLSEVNYKHLDSIRQDKEPLPFWSSIVGMVSILDGEILRFILENKIPLDKIIRHELALRGYNENHRWCGFDKAREIWLNDNP